MDNEETEQCVLISVTGLVVGSVNEPANPLANDITSNIEFGSGSLKNCFYIEDQLIKAVENYCEYDGKEYNSDGDVNFYLYGSDCEAIYEKIKPVLLPELSAYSFAVTLRSGCPGSPERIIEHSKLSSD
jgi:hypothetical protein